MIRQWLAFVLLLHLTFLGGTKAVKGLDVSRLMFQFDLECFKEKGYEFVVVRAYRTIGCFPDPDGSDTLVKTSRAGFKNIEIYMSPCPGGYKSATSQVDEMSKFDKNYHSLILPKKKIRLHVVKALPQNVSINHIWLEVQVVWYNNIAMQLHVACIKLTSDFDFSIQVIGLEILHQITNILKS